MAVSQRLKPPFKPFYSPSLHEPDSNPLSIFSCRKDTPKSTCIKSLYLECGLNKDQSEERASFRASDLTRLVSHGSVGFTIVETARCIQDLAEMLILAHPKKEAIDQVIIDFRVWTERGLLLSDSIHERPYISCSDLLNLLSPHISYRCNFVFRGLFQGNSLDYVERSLKALQGCNFYLRSGLTEHIQLRFDSSGTVIGLDLPALGNPALGLTDPLQNLSLGTPDRELLKWDRDIKTINKAFHKHNTWFFENFDPNQSTTLMLLAPYKSQIGDEKRIQKTINIVNSLSDRGNIFCFVLRYKESIDRISKMVRDKTGAQFQTIVISAESNDGRFILSRQDSESFNTMSSKELVDSARKNVVLDCTYIFPNPSPSVAENYLSANVYTPPHVVDELEFVTDSNGRIITVDFLSRKVKVTSDAKYDPLGLEDHERCKIPNRPSYPKHALIPLATSFLGLDLQKRVVFRQMQAINRIALKLFNQKLPTTLYVLPFSDRLPSQFYNPEAFRDSWIHITDLSKNGNVFCTIASKVDEISSVLRQVYELKKGAKFDQMVVCGHSQPTQSGRQLQDGAVIALTTDCDPGSALSAKNFEREVFPYLSRSATVVFDSCSTGLSPNAIAPVLHRKFPDVRFLAPHLNNTTGTVIEVDAKGIIRDVSFTAYGKMIKSTWFYNRQRVSQDEVFEV